MAELSPSCKKSGHLFTVENTGYHKNGSRYCKQCKRQRAKDAYQTPRGKAFIIWAGIKKRAGNNSGNYPTYINRKLLMTREEFLQWIIPELENWIKTYNTLDGVSVDRINNSGHYEISNLQLITKVENSCKSKEKFLDN